MKGWLGTKTFVEIREKGVSPSVWRELIGSSQRKTLEIYSVKGIRFGLEENLIRELGSLDREAGSRRRR